MTKKLYNKSKRNVLITGGAGFIGSNFVNFWLESYPDDYIVILDALTYAGNINSLEKSLECSRCTFIHGSICNQALVYNILKTHKISLIVNLAAESHVDRSITGAKDFIETNIVGTFSLLEAAKRYWLEGEVKIEEHHFHHVSTDEVYGSLHGSDDAFTEDMQYQPNSPYSASKAASDHLVRAYHHTYGLNVTTSNCSNNYGPYHFPEKLIPLVILNLLHNKPVPVYGDGSQIRDWLHVKDHCQGIGLIINSGVKGEIYNIGGNNEWKNIDIVCQICTILMDSFQADKQLAVKFPLAKKIISGKCNELITYVGDRLGHDKRYAIDNSKISDGLGFKPQYLFEEGLKETIQWYLKNNNWWQPLYSC